MPYPFLAISFIFVPLLFFFVYPKLIRIFIRNLPLKKEFKEERIFYSFHPLRFIGFPLYFAYLLKTVELDLLGTSSGMKMVWLHLAEKMNQTLFVIMITIFLYRVLYQVSKIFMLAIHRPLSGEGSFLGALVFVLRAVLILLATSIVLSFWGVNIAGLLTGLGLSSLALAFAAQDTFSNLFGGATVHMDRPFTKGDFITIEDYSGVVEKIGFRSTQLRTADEKVIIVPNSKLITGFLVNESRMRQRRVHVDFKLNTAVTKKSLEAFRTDLLEKIQKRGMAKEEAQIYLLGADDVGLVLTIRYYLHSKAFDEWMLERSLLVEDVIELSAKYQMQFRFHSNETHDCEREV